jgi:hypothetical protein
MTQFPTEANCIEPWRIDVSGGNIGPLNAVADIGIRVYDWQGNATHGAPVIECPELFTGTVTGLYGASGPGYTDYEATISNTNMAPSGEYRCLVSVEANENDPVNAPWFDLTAYQVHTIEVSGSFNMVEVTPEYLNFHPNKICIQGSVAYLAAGFNGLHFFDVSNPANPTWIGRVNTPSQAFDVAVSNGYAFVADYADDLVVVDVDPIGSAYIVKTINLNGATLGIDVAGGYAYTTGSTYPGTVLYIIDISDPENPLIVNSVIGSGAGVDVVVSGGYAYAANNDCSLQIFDVDPPGTASLVQTISTPGYSSDIAINGPWAYLAMQSVGLQVIDIDPPETANIVHTVPTGGDANGVSIAGNYAFVANVTNGVAVVDITNPATASVVAIVGMPFGMYCARQINNQYTLFGGKAGGLLVLDISNPLSPNIPDIDNSPGGAYAVESDGDRLYSANYDAGMMITDVTTPANPVVTNRVVMPNAHWITVEGYYAYVTDLVNGLVLVDISTPGSETIADSVTFASSPSCVAVSGTYAYVAAGSSGLYIVENNPPGTLNIINNVPTAYSAEYVDIQGNYAYVATTTYPNTKLDIVNVVPPGTASIVHSVALTGDRTYNPDVSGNYAYVPVENNGLVIVDISTPTTAFVTNTLPSSAAFQSVEYVSGYLFCADYTYGLTVFDVSPVATASLITTFNTEGYFWDVNIAQNYAYLAAGAGGIRIIRLY